MLNIKIIFRQWYRMQRAVVSDTGPSLACLCRQIQYVKREIQLNVIRKTIEVQWLWPYAPSLLHRGPTVRRPSVTCIS